MLLLLIISAIICLLFLLAGIYLARKRFRTGRINGSYSFRETVDSEEPGGSRKREWRWHRQKIRGVGAAFEVRYTIPEFYSKIRSGDIATRRIALMVFGASGFVFFTLLAVGTLLVQSDQAAGWLIIGMVLLTFVFVVFSHIRAARRIADIPEKDRSGNDC